MQGPPKVINVTAQRVTTRPVSVPGTQATCLLVGVLLLANLALFPSLQQAARLPMTLPPEEPITWSLEAPRASYKPGAPKKVLLVDDSYRQMRTDVETFTQSVADIRHGIRQQVALSDLMIVLKGKNPNITAEQAQKLLLDAGYDIPTPEVAEALKAGQTQFLQDDNAARAKFVEEIAQEIIVDKISGFLKNIELITRVGQYVLIDAPEQPAPKK